MLSARLAFREIRKHNPNINRIKSLIDKTNVNSRDKYGNTFLHLACFGFVLELIEYFISLDADVNSVNSYGDTPCHLLFYRFRLRDQRIPFKVYEFAKVKPLRDCRLIECTMEFLILSGFNPSICNNDGQTVLHNCPVKLSHYILDLLVNSGLLINTKDINGDAALHGACMYMMNDTIVSMIKNGANPNTRNFSGFLPLHYLFHYYRFGSPSDRNERVVQILDTMIEYGLDKKYVVHKDTFMSQAIQYTSPMIITRMIAHEFPLENDLPVCYINSTKALVTRVCNNLLLIHEIKDDKVYSEDQILLATKLMTYGIKIKLKKGEHYKTFDPNIFIDRILLISGLPITINEDF